MTDRELEVLELMAEGLRTSEIAAQPRVAEVTGRGHVSSAVGNNSAWWPSGGDRRPHRTFTRMNDDGSSGPLRKRARAPDLWGCTRSVRRSSNDRVAA